MIHLYDLNKVKIRGLIKYKDLHVESVLVSGDKTLSFLYPQRLCKEVKEEGYIRTKTDEFVIKEINPTGEYNSITCKLNLDELEGKAWEKFESVEQTIENCINFAIVSTGWTCELHGTHTKKRTIRKTNCSALALIKQARTTYRVELKFDTLLKKIHVYETLGSDKGVYFTEELNARNISPQSNSYDFFTRIIAIGKNTADEEGNDTTIKVTLENHQYSSKVKTLIWKDERYSNLEALTEDATYKLNEISKPHKAIEVSVIDLAKINPKYSILAYELGDTVRLISKHKEINEKQRIVIADEYLDEPHRNTVQIANSILTFEDIQQEYEETVDTVNNITSDNGTISESAIKSILGSVSIDKVIIQRIEAVEAVIGTLEATYAKITELDAITANITYLNAEVAKIGTLEAQVAKIGILEVDVGYIKDLVNGNLTSDNIQSLILTSAKVTVENGFIKNAMIESLDVSKVNAGKISTNKFEISSDDGGIVIVGATQQFRDSKGNVRLQLGQDAQGGFNFILRGEDGTSILIDHTGIKEKAITKDLIKENMIAENAVGQKQIDYSSFAEGFNADTNTSFIKATHIKLNNQDQTLDVAFNEMTTTVNGHTETLGTNTTAIGVHQGQISALISNTTITKENGVVVQLKDEYNTTVATVNSINSVIGSHTTSINALTGQVEAVDTKTNEMKRTLDETVIKVASLQTELAVNIIKNGDFKKETEDWEKVKGFLVTENSMTYLKGNSTTSNSMGCEQVLDKSKILPSNTYIIRFLARAVPNKTTDTTLQCIKTMDIKGYKGSTSTTLSTIGTGMLEIAKTDTEYTVSITTKADLDVNAYDKITFEFGLRYLVMGQSNESVQVTNIEFVKPQNGNFASVDSVAKLQVQADKISATVTENKKDIDGKVSTLESNFNVRASGIESTVTANKKNTDEEISKINQKAGSIESTVTANKKDADGKISTVQSSITQLSGQITSKVDANGVKSIIEQNPDSLKVGFNQINNNFEVTPTWVYTRTSSGKNSIGFSYGKMYVFNPNTGSQIGTIGADLFQNGYGLHISQNEYTYMAISQTYGTNKYMPWFYINFGGIVDKDRGVGVNVPLYMNGYDIVRPGNIKFSDTKTTTLSYGPSSGSVYDTVKLSLQAGDYFTVRRGSSKAFEISPTAGNHFWEDLNMHNYHITQCANINTVSLEVQDINIVEDRAYLRNTLVKKTVTKTLVDNTETIGSAVISNGKCEIELPLDIMYSSYSVFISTVGRYNLYVTEKLDDRFTVESDIDCKFEYLIKFIAPQIAMFAIEEPRRFEQETKSTE